MFNNIYYVYCHQKMDDGKTFYIGKGKNKRAYCKYGRSQHWYNTVKKHGGFDVVILVNNISEEKAFELEKDFIKQIGVENLVNKTEGGEGLSGWKHSDETKRKIKELKANISQETRIKMSLARKGTKASQNTIDKMKQRTGDKNPFYGKRFTDKQRKHLSDLKQGKLHNKARKVIQLDMTTLEVIKIWDCIKEAVLSLKICKSSITECCQGKRKSAGGFIWRYYSDFNDKDLVIEKESVNTV